MKLAKSLAGHDAGRIYCLLSEDDNNVYLADGQIKTLNNPKKKRKKHVQIIKSLPREVRELLEGDAISDAQMKKALKIYRAFLL